MSPLVKMRLILGLAMLGSSAMAEEVPFPFANGTFDDKGKLQAWTLDKVHWHRDNAIGINIAAAKSIMEKDSAANPDFLAYKSSQVETITSEPDLISFSPTDLDLTGEIGFVQIAIQVDDIAILKVDEVLTGKEESGHVPFKGTYEVKGTALWNVQKSYKEFNESDKLIPAGRKYKLTLEYRNTANLTEKYGGKIDFDGVNVFLILTSVEIVQPTVDAQGNGGALTKVDDVRFSRWWKAYPDAAPFNLNKGFIKDDPDRFVIRIPAAVASDKTTVKAKLSTKAPQGMENGSEYEQAATVITLTKNGGWFESNPMILVTNKADADDANTGVKKAQDDTEDATFIAWMGGSLEIDLPSVNDTKIKYPVSASKKQIAVEAAIVNAQGAGSFAAVNQAFDKSKKRAKETYAQHLIELRFTKPPTSIPFTGKVNDALKERYDASGNVIDGLGNLEWRYQSLLSPEKMLLDVETRQMLDEVATQAAWSGGAIRVVYLPYRALS